MKITIWTYEQNLKHLHNFLNNDEPLEDSFEYFLTVPSLLEDIYVVQVLLSYDDYIRLRDY